MSLTNLGREKIQSDADLPQRYTAWTPCFRSEAGSAGRDVRGMIRQHQFTKVELVSITTAEQGLEEHERMTNCAEEILKRLGLAYRTMLLCTGDMGFASTQDLRHRGLAAGPERLSGKSRVARYAATFRPGGWARATVSVTARTCVMSRP